MQYHPTQEGWLDLVHRRCRLDVPNEVEHILGIKKRGDMLFIDRACLQAGWSIRLFIGMGTPIQYKCQKPNRINKGVGKLLFKNVKDNVIHLVDDGKDHNVVEMQ